MFPFSRHPSPSASFFTPAVGMLALASVASSCAGLSLVDVWKDPDYPKAPLTSLMAVDMSGDAATRRLWEDGFVRELGKHGVTATPSYRQFPDAVPDTEQIVTAVRAGRYDGVLLTHQLSTETERQYVPGYTTVVPVTVQNPWNGHYATYYREIHRHGYTETDQVVRHETDVWSTRDGDRLVWTGVGEVIDPSSDEAVHREIARMVVPELARKGVIPSRSRNDRH